METLPQAAHGLSEQDAALAAGAAVALSPAQKRVAVASVMTLLLVGLILTPLANTPMRPVPGFMTAYGAAMLVSNLLLASLLFGRGATEQRAGTVQLGSAYFFVGAIFVPLMLSFPNGLIQGSVIGVQVSPVWLWSMWHAGFGLAIARYVFTLRRSAAPAKSRHPGRVRNEVLATLLVVIGLAALATVGLDYLPPLLSNGHTFFAGSQQLIPYGILAIDIAALLCIARLPALGPEQAWLCVGMVAACVDVWLTFQGSDRFSLGWYVSKLCSLATTLTVLISLFRELNQLYRRVSQANTVLAGLAQQDGLTGLANRRHFDETLAAEWARSFRARLPMSLLMIDVDLFKQFNDRYGHAEGDNALRRVAQLTHACTRRAGDLTARYGGEEFAVVLPDTDLAGASVMAALLRRELAELAIPHADSPSGQLTLSVGIAMTQPRQTSPLDLLRAADAALYQAKNEGRDRACLAPTGAAGTPAGWAEEDARLDLTT